MTVTGSGGGGDTRVAAFFFGFEKLSVCWPLGSFRFVASILAAASTAFLTTDEHPFVHSELPHLKQQYPSVGENPSPQLLTYLSAVHALQELQIRSDVCVGEMSSYSSFAQTRSGLHVLSDVAVPCSDSYSLTAQADRNRHKRSSDPVHGRAWNSSVPHDVQLAHVRSDAKLHV